MRLFCCFLLALPIVAKAIPAQILLIRHAEKPAVGNDLSPQGWRRAEALPALFRGRPEFQKFGAPVALYAMKPKPNGKSARAVETLKFVSQDLGLSIRANYKRDDYQPMVNEILADPNFDGKLVVICWEHHVLSAIAAAFGVRPTPKYPSGRFDRAWLLTLNADGTVAFQDLPERLLPDDSPTADQGVGRSR